MLPLLPCTCATGLQVSGVHMHPRSPLPAGEGRPVPVPRSYEEPKLQEEEEGAMGPGVRAASSVHWHKELLWTARACSSVPGTCRLPGFVVPRPLQWATGLQT